MILRLEEKAKLVFSKDQNVFVPQKEFEVKLRTATTLQGGHALAGECVSGEGRLATPLPFGWP